MTKRDKWCQLCGQLQLFSGVTDVEGVDMPQWLQPKQLITQLGTALLPHPAAWMPCGRCNWHRDRPGKSGIHKSMIAVRKWKHFPDQWGVIKPSFLWLDAYSVRPFLGALWEQAGRLATVTCLLRSRHRPSPHPLSPSTHANRNRHIPP